MTTRKLSFAEGMSKLSKENKEKKVIERNENITKTGNENDKNKSKVKKKYEEFNWISKYKEPNKINFNLPRNQLEECFTIESYSFSSDNTKTRFILSGFGLRRPWILWKEEWDSEKDKFVNLQPIVGISKSDTNKSEVAIIEMFKRYVKSIGHKVKADYIEDSVLISENKILKIIKAKQNTNA
jgi:hypothetical protein